MTPAPTMFQRYRARNPGQSFSNMLVFEACWRALHLLFAICFRVRRYGMDRVPPHGPLLVVANHESHLDPPLVGLCITNRHLSFVAREGLFRNRFFGALITALNSLPVGEDRSDLRGIRTFLKYLGERKALLIFPEGSRTPDGRLQEFKRGTWLLLSRARCPVLPVAVRGCYEAWPRRRALPTIFGPPVSCMVGRPIPAEQLIVLGADGALALLRARITELRGELDRLAHPEFVPVPLDPSRAVPKVPATPTAASA
ncbi:MAG: 1-acyl-sn-glycerol-3-phosphate acyltransferase [Phycisphaerae bacterium]|nr:1-acyl-sn-glycerol-3-phosphate acyltransferase [Phycisphaerae bacterium]